jgi:hypothetical protein
MAGLFRMKDQINRRLLKNSVVGCEVEVTILYFYVILRAREFNPRQQRSNERGSM